MAKSKKPRTTRHTDIAVVDIGSNSVRLVIYRKQRNSHSVIYEDKTVCGLARDLVHARPKLHTKGVALALKALKKFKNAIEIRQPTKVHAIGTAAMRAVAKTRAGRDFHKRAEIALGHKIKIISGRKEAHLTALGVISSLPNAIGLCGDLGGGSLELATIHRGLIENTITLNLGSLTLISESGNDPIKAESLIHVRLSKVKWLGELEGATFYPIGGSWRAVARVMMKKMGRPVRLVQGFSIKADVAWRYAEEIARQKPSAFRKMHKKIRHRADVIPYAAAALAEIIIRTQPKYLVFSGHGVREGLIVEKTTC